jgi:hypothetical protein
MLRTRPFLTPTRSICHLFTSVMAQSTHNNVRLSRSACCPASLKIQAPAGFRNQVFPQPSSDFWKSSAGGQQTERAPLERMESSGSGASPRGERCPDGARFEGVGNTESAPAALRRAGIADQALGMQCGVFAGKIVGKWIHSERDRRLAEDFDKQNLGVWVNGGAFMKSSWVSSPEALSRRGESYADWAGLNVHFWRAFLRLSDRGAPRPFAKHPHFSRILY